MHYKVAAAASCWTAAPTEDIAPIPTNATKFSFRPASIDAVVLSHAHIDHSGNL